MIIELEIECDISITWNFFMFIFLNDSRSEISIDILPLFMFYKMPQFAYCFFSKMTLL